MANKIWGYTVVAYPESMPENWRIELNNLPFGYCYCLHDKDPQIDKITGEIALKKAHIHFFFQGHPTSRQKEYIHATLHVSYGEDVRNPRKMYEYLTHQNNPDKYHYPVNSISYSDKWEQELFDQACSYSSDPEHNAVELITIMKQFYEYTDLMDYLVEQDRMDLLHEAQKSWVQRYMYSKLMSSRAEKVKEHETQKEEWLNTLRQKSFDEDRKR